MLIIILTNNLDNLVTNYCLLKDNDGLNALLLIKLTENLL